MPMLQRYHPEAMKKIYSLSGFRDMSGSHVVMQAALKILQQPRHLGIGLCFEEAEVIPDLAQQTIWLCERIGYYGAFELEFIVAQGRMLLIDFNGRFYNQLAFDIARGMDLPGMVYAGATGATEELERLVSRVPLRDKEQPLVFCNGFGLSLSVAAQQIFKKMSREEATHWLEWRKTYEGRVVDAIHDFLDDPLPAVFDIASRVGQYMRYPRKFLGDMAFKQTHVLAAVSAGCGVLLDCRPDRGRKTSPSRSCLGLVVRLVQSKRSECLRRRASCTDRGSIPHNAADVANQTQRTSPRPTIRTGCRSGTRQRPGAAADPGSRRGVRRLPR